MIVRDDESNEDGFDWALLALVVDSDVNEARVDIVVGCRLLWERVSRCLKHLLLKDCIYFVELVVLRVMNRENECSFFLDVVLIFDFDHLRARGHHASVYIQTTQP